MHRSALFGLLLLCSCSVEKQLPPLAAGLPTDVRQAEAEFNRRVSSEFPVGTSEAAVRSTLLAQGFEVSSVGAKLERNQFPCSTSWIVRWQASTGKLTSIQGIYGYACP
jgi:hypothetical protein